MWHIVTFIIAKNVNTPAIILKRLKMELNYENFISSSQEKTTILHRTDKCNLEEILSQGLCVGVDGNLSSTATIQPRDKEKAKNIYFNGEDHGPIVVVLQIPNEIWNEVYYRLRPYVATSKKIGYFHPKRKEYTINPDFVVAWINRAGNQVHLNPFPIIQRKSAKGYEKYLDMMND
jgi:hypothetical protein